MNKYSFLKKIVLTLAVLGLIAGCSTTQDNKGDGGNVKLTFATNLVGEKANALESAIKEFEEQTGYSVDFQAPGSSYEELMKTKMSSNEMPDVFTTHGWSVARYGAYLEPINDRAWAKDISPQIKPVLEDKDGSMYALPVNMDIAGIIYNVEVLDSVGINVDDINTWDDFTKAAETLKASDKTAITIGGKDNWTIGQFFDWVAPSFYVTDEKDNQREQLKSGNFDKGIWEEVASLLDEWTKAGYINSDALTADYNGDMKALAEGNAAFGFYANSSVVDVLKLNPDAKIGMMPIPSAKAGDEPTLIAGEDVAVGVWKDSKVKEEALELLDFLAQPEVSKKIAEAAGSKSGLMNVEVEIGEIGQYYDKHAEVKTFPYFDREYLPSGMWDVMCATGADILAQKDGAVENAGKIMEQNFNDKFTE